MGVFQRAKEIAEKAANEEGHIDRASYSDDISAAALKIYDKACEKLCIKINATRIRNPVSESDVMKAYETQLMQTIRELESLVLGGWGTTPRQNIRVRSYDKDADREWALAVIKDCGGSVEIKGKKLLQMSGEAYIAFMGSQGKPIGGKMP